MLYVWYVLTERTRHTPKVCGLVMCKRCTVLKIQHTCTHEVKHFRTRGQLQLDGTVV
jgi:hypothetical protein